MKAVTILGTRWRIEEKKREEDTRLEAADGYTDWTTRGIVLCAVEADKDSVRDIDAYKRKVLRHEIVHAFLFESGMCENSGESECWGMDETIVDWIAIQGPKIYRAWMEAGAIY